MKKILKLISWGLPLFLVSCAFDIVHVKQIPTNITHPSCTEPCFKLKDNVHINLGTGYSRILKKDTNWKYVGKITEGNVYLTKDQIVTVEASNIYEAYIVVSNQKLVGFYLPVERTFCPIEEPIKLNIQIIN